MEAILVVMVALRLIVGELKSLSRLLLPKLSIKPNKGAIDPNKGAGRFGSVVYKFYEWLGNIDVEPRRETKR